MGGSYANLCFAQLLQELRITGGLPPHMVFGDMYTFGCPRIGQNEFAKSIRDNLTHEMTGSSWRIVNDNDLVPKVPPVWKLDPEFIHLNEGYTIKKDAKPQKLASEIDTHTIPPPFPTTIKELFGLLKQIRAHGTSPSPYSSISHS